MVTGTLVAMMLASSHPQFPVPQDKGQAAPAPDAKSYTVHRSLRALERDYRMELKGDKDIAFQRGADPKGPYVTILNASKHADWTRATLRGDDVTTTIEVTRLMRLSGGDVEGKAPHQVAVLVPRSVHVQQQLQQIDADHAPAR